MDGGTDRVIIDGEIGMNGPNDHLSGMQSDTNVGLGVRRSTHRVLHVEGCVGSPDGAVFVSQRRTKQRHDAIAFDPIDRTFETMNRIDHGLQCRTQALIRLFRIEVLNQAGRALDVSEKNSDLLALALQRSTGFEKTARQMPRQIDGGRYALARILPGLQPRRSSIRAATAADKAGSRRERATSGTLFDKRGAATPAELGLGSIRATTRDADHGTVGLEKSSLIPQEDTDILTPILPAHTHLARPRICE